MFERLSTLLGSGVGVLALGEAGGGIRLLAAALMGLAVYGSLPHLVPLLGPAFGLALGITVGALSYPAILFAISPALIHRLVGLLGALRRRDRDRLGLLLGDTV